jgi:hypothetical protein
VGVAVLWDDSERHESNNKTMLTEDDDDMNTRKSKTEISKENNRRAPARLTM